MGEIANVTTGRVAVLVVSTGSYAEQSTLLCTNTTTWPRLKLEETYYTKYLAVNMYSNSMQDYILCRTTCYTEVKHKVEYYAELQIYRWIGKFNILDKMDDQLKTINSRIYRQKRCRRGSNSRPSACEADVITTTPRDLATKRDLI